MSLDIIVRRTLTLVDEKLAPPNDPDQRPLRRLAAVLVVVNPYVGRFVQDLQPMIQASERLGQRIARQAVEAFGPHQVESYGKGAIVGLAGEFEHASALLTTTFAEPLRAAVGGGKAWISSFVKVAAPGSTIDVPMAHKDALYVRSHYDGLSVMIPEGPQSDEIALIVTIANRGRLLARVGGIKASEIKGEDGLR